MRAIYKYQVMIDDRVHSHQIPAGAILRHVAQQGHAPCVWAEVDTTLAPIARRFRVFGTGHPIPDGYRYVGTAFDTPFVWHVFEQLPESETVI